MPAGRLRDTVGPVQRRTLSRMKGGAVMSTRYLTNAAIAIAIAVVLIVAVAQFDRSRGAVSRTLDGVLGALGIWTIVASQIFTGSAVMWLSFAEALGFVGLAFIGLTVHEVDTWRTLHGLDATAPADADASREEP